MIISDGLKPKKNCSIFTYLLNQTIQNVPQKPSNSTQEILFCNSPGLNISGLLEMLHDQVLNYDPLYIYISF